MKKGNRQARPSGVKENSKGAILGVNRESCHQESGERPSTFKKICIYLSYEHSGLNLREIGEYFGKQRSAISQLSRRFAETIKGDKELRKVVSDIEKEDLLNVAA